MNVRITVSLRGRTVPIEQVTDRRISDAFLQAGRQVSSKLDRIRCPVHGQTASNVRLHFDASGGADLQYDSCCEQLGKAIGREMG
jgi:phosphotransferase system IIA component